MPGNNIPMRFRLLFPTKNGLKTGTGKIFPLFSPETYHESRVGSPKLNVLLTGSHFDIEYLKNPDPLTTLVMFTFYPEKEPYAADRFLKCSMRTRSGSMWF